MSTAERLFPIVVEDDIVLARRAGRALALTAGFSAVSGSEVALVISELARNILVHAGTGAVVLRVVHPKAALTMGGAGIEVVARDTGPGIPDLDLAMKDGFSTREGLGMGLPGTQRLVDEFDVQTTDEGTTVTVIKWSHGRW